MSTATVTPLIDPHEVERALELFLAEGRVTEIRALDATVNGDRWPGVYTGYFDNASDALTALDGLSSAKGIYFTPNPVDPALIARANNRIRRANKGDSTSDHDIARRHWLLVDCDAQRPAGVSATDEEHAAAIKRVKSIAHELHFNYGWPSPIVADSGNGGHLKFRIDEPAEDGGLVERCLKALASKFSDDVVKVDTSVHNAARIWKLPGTRACKGDSTSDRPHRMSKILNTPSQLGVVSHDHLVALADEAPATEKSHETNGKAPGTAFDIDAFIARHGFEVSGPDPYQGGRRWTFTRSAMCEHHDDGPYLIQFESGALAAGCHHESCSWNWHDLRAKYEPKPERQGMPDWRPAEYREEPRPPIECYTADQLHQQFPRLNPVVIEGLGARGRNDQHHCRSESR